MEGYLRAASQISRLAVGDRNASASSTTWKVPRTASQMRHVEGAPLGTRGGLSVLHTFPADGDYLFKIMLHMGPTGDLFGGPYRGEQIEVSIDGERVALMDINPRMNEQDPNGLTMQTPTVHIKAGQHRVSAAFVQRFEGPADDLIMPIEHTLADTNIGEVFGTTALTHLRDFTVAGPMSVTGVSDTESRRRDFHLPPHQRSRGVGLRRRHHQEAGGPGVSRPRAAGRLQGPDVVLRAGPQAGRGLRGRHSPRRAGDSRQPALPVPHRADAGGAARRARPTASAITTSRRACRSSCGARCRMPSC